MSGNFTEKIVMITNKHDFVPTCTDFQMHFKGRNSVNREGIFFGISPNREDIAAAIEKSNVIVRKGAYEHVALTVTQVK